MINIDDVRRRKARGEELSDEEYQALCDYWKAERAKPAPKSAGRKYDRTVGYLAKLTGPVVQQADQTQLFCSYCGDPIERITATFANQPKFYRAEELGRDENNELDINEKLIITNQHVAACPNHAHLIKPRITKDGEYAGHNMKFPPSLEDC